MQFRHAHNFRGQVPTFLRAEWPEAKAFARSIAGKVTGSIADNKYSFSVEVGTEQKLTLAYTGTLDGDTVKGNVTMGEMGEGTFTGKRR
mgnify:CR=1 FL=1